MSLFSRIEDYIYHEGYSGEKPIVSYRITPKGSGQPEFVSGTPGTINPLVEQRRKNGDIITPINGNGSKP